MQTDLKGKKVILGLSGGVDSAASALVLQNLGAEVVGLYFNVLPEGDKRRSEGLNKAKRIAEQLGIKLISKDLSKPFDEVVISNFCNEYANGRTPNPCIICNPSIKFRALMDGMAEENADFIATGHYADTVYSEETGLWHVKKALNEAKDQSYMLYRLDQQVISHLILPLNSAESKDEIRRIARDNALDNADDRDSQEICFIDEDDNYRDFILRRGFSDTPGNFVDGEGSVIATHSGIMNYTIGQRKGLGVALGKPAFVLDVNSETGDVTLGDNAELFATEVISSDNIISGVVCESTENKLCKQILNFSDAGELTAKIRYASKPAECKLEFLPQGRLKTVFAEPQRAVTPGQSIVIYRSDTVIGGGFIE